MSGEGNGKQRRYQIAYSGSVRKEIEELAYEAFLLGKRAEFDTALATIVRRLRNDPWNFGEMVQELHHLKLAIHIGSVFPVTVRFGIHRERPIIFIAKVFLIKPS
jgi:hypothetical protein